jgi:hypothetical protein
VVVATNTTGAWQLADLVLSEDILNNAAGIAYGAGVVTGIAADQPVGTKVFLSTAGGRVYSAPGGAGTAVQTVGVVTTRHASAGAIDFFPGDHVVAAAATGDIADDAITLAKIEDGTAAQIIVCDTDGEPAYAALSGDATIDDTGRLSLTGKQVKVLSQMIAFGDFVDDGGTSGYLDLTDKIPAGSFVLGWLYGGSDGFTGDVSAQMEVGVVATADKYSAVANGSVFGAAATVGSICKTTGVVLELVEATVRVTVTTATDFTKVAGGSGTIDVLYV